MIKNIEVFENEQFGKIRTLEENGKILFCGSDVAKALGYSDTPKAIKTHCKEDGWTIHPVTDSLGREQQAKFINEGNLYRLITHSKLPSAEKFESWVFDEVLPSIRKHGTYTHEKATTSNGSEDSSIEAELGRALISGDMSQISTAIGKVMSIKNAQIEQQQEEIQLLENKNANLKINNTALADEILSWETRSSVNKAIRVISGMIGMDIPVVWSRLYNELYYKHGINLRRRKRTGKKSILDTVKEKEWKPLIQSLTALCEAWDIDMSIVMEKAKLCA